MKNLNIWNVFLRDMNIDFNNKSAIAYGHNCSENNIFVCSHNLSLTYNKLGVIQWTKDLTMIASPESSPINLTYLSLLNTLCVGLEHGELVTINDDGSSCQLVGICEAGFLDMEWSPDHELLVLVTKEMKAILMSCTYDPIQEIDLLDNNFGERQFITVGWGKKETQFHGSEGKQAAKAKNEVIADPNLDSDPKIKITWRGDGSLYAIGFTIDGIRIFKVFDREGHVQYTSEKQQGLETNLCWRPSGNVIATTQRLPDKYLVAFFEKNGLKHGGFTIPVNSTTQVENLAWSNDSEILALQCRETMTNVQTILLFTSSNYHWYLKQTLTFDKEQKIYKLTWNNDYDITNNKKLNILLTNGQHYTYSWVWDVNRSKGSGNEDDAIVSVIDGEKILITGFRHTVVPPPMSALELDLKMCVNSVHFAPQTDNNQDFDTNSFLACTTNHQLLFYDQVNKMPLKYELSKQLHVGKYEFPFQYYNWHWFDKDTIFCIKVENKNHSLVEWTIKLDQIVQKNVEHLPAPALNIETHPTAPNSLFIQLLNGEIIRYNRGGSFYPLDIAFEVACPTFKVVDIEGDLYFLGLSHKGYFYVNNIKIMHNASSFFVHTHFLLVTTLQHVLLCTKLTKLGMDNLKDHENYASSNLYKRKIERGSKLIIAVPNDTRTILQMPRGNLEAIQPRPLSLKIIGEYLDTHKYFEAFDLMRKQRINLNLIYDHDPEKFLENIDAFLGTIDNNSWLSLFLSDLENVDVTKTMYSSSYDDKRCEYDNGIKVQKICDIIRGKLLERPDKDCKILPILTTFVKKNTNDDLEKALLVIKDLKLQESYGKKLPVSSDEALKYLLYMVEVNNLFDVALGMYDFDLVLFVANKSQKDPKEFIPMLNEMNEMEENYKKFTINKHLKRYDRAVQFLAKCGAEKHNELKTFIKYHSLYQEGLRFFTPNDDIYKGISDDFGLYLKLKKQYTEAGLVYERAGHENKAIDCYKEALEWELAIKLAAKWPKDEYKKICWELVVLLKEEKRHKEALVLLEQIDSCEDAIIYAIENGQYKTAIRLCSMHNKVELRDEKLFPSLIEDYNNLQDLVENNWSNFTKYRKRLSVVRENKLNNPPEAFDGYLNKDCDLYSDVGSTLASSASRSSGRTFRSSKNRRKHERKVASLKEGSQHEDVALVMALHNIILTSFDLRSTVKEINISLSWFHKDKEAFILQTSLDKLLKEMKESFQTIWSNEFLLEATNASIQAQNMSEGYNSTLQRIATLEPHLRIAPVINEVSWKLEGLYV